MAESVEESFKVVAKCGHCIPCPLLCHAFLSALLHLAFLSLKTVFNVCFECANRTHCKQMRSRRHILFVHSSRCSLRGGQIILCFADKAGCLLCPTVFGSATLSVLCPAQSCFLYSVSHDGVTLVGYVVIEWLLGVLQIYFEMFLNKKVITW